MEKTYAPTHLVVLMNYSYNSKVLKWLSCIQTMENVHLVVHYSTPY